MATIKQIMIQKGEEKSSRGFSTNAIDVVYNDDVTKLGASDVQKALELLSVKINSKNLDGDKKMDKINPTGTGSLSLNRKNGSSVGDYSAAIGYNNVASGDNSFAEGQNTIASGDNSHTAGSGSVATAPNTFAIGQETKAENNQAFAEGYATIASGKQSHAGGLKATTAADNSFAFGEDITIDGDKNNSSAIGTGLKPTVSKEIVVGNYNNDKAIYAESEPSFVVGIGTEEENRKDGLVVLKDGTTIVSNDVQIRNGNTTISLNQIHTKVKEGFYKELTQKQYDALSDKEKKNGTVYYIKDSDPFDVAWDKVKLSRFGASEGDPSIKFGVDADGNFGYIKPGADTVIPFNGKRSMGTLMKTIPPIIKIFGGGLVEIKEYIKNE